MDNFGDYVFVNLCGKWVELGNNDTIEDEHADSWASINMKGGQPIPNKYLKVNHQGTFYMLHPSHITLVGKR